MNQRILIIILGSVLGLVLAASLAVLYILPSTNTDAPVVEPELAGNEATLSTAGFDLRVLARSAYKALDQGLIQRGLLPIQPPTGVGKPNPFL